MRPTDDGLSDDERALQRALAMPSATLRSDSAFCAHVRDGVREKAPSRRMTFVLPTLAGACALAAVALLVGDDPSTRNAPASIEGVARVDKDVPSTDDIARDLVEEDALHEAVVDAVARDDASDALVDEELDDDTLLALAPLLHALLARVATR
jgi:hypothetical protein